MTTADSPPGYRGAPLGTSAPNDAAVVRALEEYRAARAAGRAPDRGELLRRYPEIAGELAACLDALDFLRGPPPSCPVPRRAPRPRPS